MNSHAYYAWLVRAFALTQRRVTDGAGDGTGLP